MKFPGVVAVLCAVPSGLVLHIGITSCTFPPWTEMSKKNNYETMKSSVEIDFLSEAGAETLPTSKYGRRRARVERDNYVRWDKFLDIIFRHLYHEII